MGNSATKEQRQTAPTARSGGSRRASEATNPGLNASPTDPRADGSAHQLYSSRNGRGSRPDLSSFLGIGTGVERDLSGPDGRRETKQEREARKLERERILRERERERSMREENVDGGYLVTQGVYTGIEDYNKSVVRQLMVRDVAQWRTDQLTQEQIERRIAPFWRGLNDHSDSWTENQLVAAARGLSIPAPDEIPAEEQNQSLAKNDLQSKTAEGNENNLLVPITSRSQSYNSDSSTPISPSTSDAPILSSNISLAASPPGSTLFKGRAKTLASLTTSSKGTQGEMVPREMSLPKDPFVNGQPVEAYLYKDAAECPICFLYYPPYLNKTRCCDQSICSECFVQIKRPDPHPPEHADPTAPSLPLPDSAEADDFDGEDALVSEPAACPFCVQPEFGATYEPPPFRRGLTYVNQGHPLNNNVASAMSSNSSLASGLSNGGRLSPSAATRRRTTSISATSPSVITTDRVRPDWHQKLTSARAHAARRSAAATALHTAAYLMGNRNHDTDSRAFAGFGRRGILRRGGGMDASVANGVSQQNMLALMAERYTAAGARGEMGSFGEGGPAGASSRGSSRRDRVDDLEEMMMMEAIRLSLASEEERRKREEKDSKKEAKKKEKENKKAEKAARKTGVYSNSTTQSATAIDRRQSEVSLTTASSTFAAGKGKEIQRTGPSAIEDMSAPPISSTFTKLPNMPDAAPDAAQGHLERARAWLQPHESSTSPTPYKPSHLRTLSNISSSTSSVNESASESLRNEVRGLQSSSDASPNASGVNIARGALTQDAFISGTPPGGGAGLEPMFNFSSLAAMVGEDEKVESLTTHVENVDSHSGGGHYDRNGESSSNTGTDQHKAIGFDVQASTNLVSKPEVPFTKDDVSGHGAGTLS